LASRRIARTKSLSGYLGSISQELGEARLRNFSTSISAEAIDASTLSEEVQILDKAIQSDNYAPGADGWRIDGSGNAEFGNVYVRGDINALSGTIGYWNISNPLVDRTFGTTTLHGTFLESFDHGPTDVDAVSGTYVSLFKSYEDIETNFTAVKLESNKVTLTISGHTYSVGDPLIVSFDDATYTALESSQTSLVTISETTYETISYSVGSYNASGAADVATTETAGTIKIYYDDVAGLYLRDYGKAEFDYGYFSNRGVSYVSSPEVNFMYNPSFEYINSSSVRVGSTTSWDLANLTSYAQTKAITNAVQSGTTVTLTVGSGHGFVIGDQVDVNDVTTVGYTALNNDNEVVLTGVATSTITYTSGTSRTLTSAACNGNVVRTAAVDPDVLLSRGSFTAAYAMQSTYGIHHEWTTTAGDDYLIGTIDYSEILNKKYTSSLLPIYFGFDAFIAADMNPITATAVTANATSGSITVTVDQAPSNDGIAIGDYVYLSFVGTSPSSGEDLIATGSYTPSELSRIYVVTAVDNTSPGFSLTVSQAGGINTTETLTLSALKDGDGEDRAYFVSKVIAGALNLEDIYITFGAVDVPLANVVDTKTTAIWAAGGNYYYTNNPSSLMNRLLDTSFGEANQTITPMSNPYPVVIDSSKLYTEYKANDPAGLAAENTIKIKIPNWAYKLTFSSVGTGIAVSATKATSYSGNNLYLVYDSFSFSTVSTPFYGDTIGALSNYDWKTSASAPSSVSASVLGTYWIDLNLDSNTFNLNGLDYIGFSSKTYAYSYRAPANINTYMGLGTVAYAPDTSAFTDPDLHYLNISSAVLQFPDPTTLYANGVYTRTRSYIDVVSSYGASGVEMSALFERLDSSEIVVNTQKSSIIAYIDEDDKSPRIALNGLMIDLNGAVTADNITANKIRLTPAVDLSASSTEHNFQIGESNGLNLRIDNNEIEALNNGVGANLNLNGAGSGTVVFGGLLDSNDTYANDITTTRRAMWISSAGVMGYASSSRTKKQDIVSANIDINSVLSVEPKQFRYIKAVEQFGNDAPIELGMIAEDLHDAGLTHFVDYGPDGDIQGIHYSTYVVALQAVVRDLAARIARLENE
jgi:hypothetical protein